MVRKIYTEDEIEAGKSKRGGFTRKQLAKWGIPWPPPHGWRKYLTGFCPRPDSMNKGGLTWFDKVPRDVRLAHGHLTQEFRDVIGPNGEKR